MASTFSADGSLRYKVRDSLQRMRFILGCGLVLVVPTPPARPLTGQKCANRQPVLAGKIAAATNSGPGIASVVLQPFVDAHILAGAVTLTATRDKIVDLEAVGFADLKPKTPMQTDNMFWIASMTKPMTATAVMMLVDEGKLSLSDPVDKYLPEFKGQQVLVQRPAASEQEGSTRAIVLESA